MSKNCYSPITGQDDVIASKVKGWNKFTAAALRGMYNEEYQSNPLNISDLDKAAETLKAYEREIKERHAKTIRSSVNNRAAAYKEVKNSFSSREAEDRVNLISSLFSDVIDVIQEANPTLSRKTICNGFVSNGKLCAGQISIFNKVYDELMRYYARSVEEGNEEDAGKYLKMMNHFGALATRARIKLRDSEGLKLGASLDFADDVNEDNYGENKLSDLYDASESRRESWQEMSDLKSAFGSVRQQVKRFLSSIPRIDENGDIETDDLGFDRTMNPVTAHQRIMRIIRNCKSESQMLSKLEAAASKEPWLEEVVKELKNSSFLRTQFLVDFHRNFQPYSLLTSKIRRGVKEFRTPIINRVRNLLSDQYMTRIMLGKPLSKSSLFNSKGNVDWNNVKKLRDTVNEYLTKPKQEGPWDTSVSKFYDRNVSSFYLRKRLVKQFADSLGIEMDNDTLNSLVARGKDLHQFTKALKDLVDYGIDKVLSKKELEQLNEGTLNKEMSYKNFIGFTPASSTAEEGVIREKINKILEVVGKNGAALRLESRAIYKDRNGNSISLSSDVTPSYLGDTVAALEEFQNSKDSAGLRRFLVNKFLKSSYFAEGNTIYNKWIEEMFNDTSLDDDGFVANFKFQRFMGTPDLNFENFTSKQHAISMIQFYFADRQISPNSQYANYPIFILGDSGVQKFIKAKRYSKDDILNGLYNVYKQERRRMELVKAANKKLEDWEYKTIDNISSKPNEYSFLPFLNSDWKSNDGTTGKYSSMIKNPTEENVKKAISAYMDEAFDNFNRRLQELGVYETTEVFNPSTKKNERKYVNLDNELSRTKKDAREVMEDYFWNTKFASIQQLQLFTVDPAFYANTKDLQKRYKEIHAPGTILSIEARDFDGNLYSEDGIERVVYFDDINVNAESIDSEFMKAIESHFGKDSDIYKAYKKNTLTDGQGYRSLDSYRKVMGMAGLWTQDMQAVYDYIKSLRASYGENEQIPAEELDKIAKMSVVFQPIKPYMFTWETFPVNEDDNLYIPVQHKYAEAVLIPELLPAGSKLRDMTYWMEENDIDVVGSTKIVKVGGFGSVSISNISSKEELDNALDNAYVHQLSYSDYRIQTNVPEHINSSQLFGTQLRKLIMANLKMDDTHYESYVGGKKVNLGGSYGEVRLNGRNLLSFYNSLIVSNIVESLDEFIDEVSSSEKLSKILIQSVVNNSRESMDNLLAYSLTGDSKFVIPLFEGALEHDSSAMLFSIFKKRVNKQSIKGGSAVQVSAMGIKGYEESGDLKYVIDPNNPNNIQYVECEIPWDLSYTNEQGEEIQLEYSEYCNADGTLKTDKNGNTLIEKKFPGILNIIAYRIPTEGCYSMINLKVKRFSQKTAGGTIKVPAQGTTIAGFDFDIDKLYFMRKEFKKRKMNPEEIKDAWDRFYNTYGNIKNQLEAAREEDTTSFDRLYKYWDKAGLPFSYREAFNQFIADRNIVSFEEYDLSKPPYENTRAARNNMLLNLVQRRLEDEETFEERFTPGGFPNSSEAARIMRELNYGNVDEFVHNGVVDFNALKAKAQDKSSDPEPNYDPSDPLTIITYNQQNQVAAKLIGIFANQNTNHAISSLLDAFKLRKPISFAGHSYSDLKNPPKGVDVSRNSRELLAASVDAVKDPVLNFLNLNTITSNAGAMLVRLGYTPMEVGLLFNQPIIQAVCEESFNNSIDVNTAIRNIFERYSKGKGVPKYYASDFPSNKLAMNIIEYREGLENDDSLLEDGEDEKEFIENQLKVLSLFNDILKTANEVNQFVTSTKFTASNAVGSTAGDFYSQQIKVSNYLKRMKSNKSSIVMKASPLIANPISDSYKITSDKATYIESLLNNPLAYEQAMYDANKAVMDVLRKYFPYETPMYSKTRNRLRALTRSNSLDADTINNMHRDFLVYILTQQGNSMFNPEYPMDNGMSARDYYTKVFPRETFEYLENNPSIKELPIFQYMQFTTDEARDTINMSVQGIGGLDPVQREAIKESWIELLDENPKLAIDLFMYNFYKSGFTFTPFSFMNLVPTEVKESIMIENKHDPVTDKYESKSYLQFLDEVLEGTAITGDNLIENFLQQYILNHTDNRNLIYRPSGQTLKAIKSLAIVNGSTVNSFEIDLAKFEGDEKAILISDDSLEEGDVAFVPCISIDGILYMCDSTNKNFNVSSDGTMTYKKVNKLGTTNQTVRYLPYSNSNESEVETGGFVEGNTSLEPVIDIDPSTFDRKALINEIADALLNSGEYSREEVNNVRESLSMESNSEIARIVNGIREEIKKNGLTDNTQEKVC